MSSSQEPLKILSLDGGGIRGLSSLLILEDIMEKIRDKRGLPSVPRPCEYFDLIGGTGTGGIIAIMLGGLRMTVNECVREYRDFARHAYTPKSTRKFRQKVASIFTPGSFSNASIVSSTFSARCLEDAMKLTIKRFFVEDECRRRRDQGESTAGTCPHEDMLFRDRTCTKAHVINCSEIESGPEFMRHRVVLAITKDNVNALPTLFKTYDSPSAFESSSIWQVARATSAAVGFFKSIRLGRDGIEFVDAAFGYNNPCEVLIHVAEREFPQHRLVRVLSIGTGLGDVITIEDSPASIIHALRNMATSSERVACNLDIRFKGDGQYFRFNVNQRLKDITISDWEEASKISAHTRNYLTKNERAIRKFVDSHFENASVGGVVANQLEETFISTCLSEGIEVS